MIQIPYTYFPSGTALVFALVSYTGFKDNTVPQNLISFGPTNFNRWT